MAVGVVGECGMGSVQHEVEITSEATVMHLLVKANILSMKLNEAQSCLLQYWNIHFDNTMNTVKPPTVDPPI